MDIFDFLKMFSPDRGCYGLSLGSSNITIARSGKGVLVDEPSVIACETYSDRIVAFGSSAKAMIGRVPDTVTTSYPVQRGVVSDYRHLIYMLRDYIGRVKRSYFESDMIAAVPSSASVVERRAVIDALKACGARKAILLENAVAAALGCGLDIFDPKGQMIIDIGGGKTEIAVLSCGGVVSLSCPEVCGIQMDRDIVSYVRKNYNILIGISTAEYIKHKLGTVCAPKRRAFLDLGGRDLMSGLPVNFVLSNEDVYKALRDSAAAVLDSVSAMIEKLPPELTQDIVKGRICLCGGCASISGWTELLMDELCIDTYIPDNPSHSVALGAAGARQTAERLSKKRTAKR